MYPQLTLTGIGLGGRKIDAAAAVKAFLGVLSAWKDYLANDNDGRGAVLIGHSQGSSMLIPLIRTQIDQRPAIRRLLVSALLMGGNVKVPIGTLVGGDFEHVPACRSTPQTGCVVAYSSFDTIRRPTACSGASAQPERPIRTRPAGEWRPAGPLRQPLVPRRWHGRLLPELPAKPFPGARGTFPAGVPAGVSTPWVDDPDLYTGTCEHADGATWLQVTDIAKPSDHRPVVREALGPTWGLHLVDVNIRSATSSTSCGPKPQPTDGEPDFVSIEVDSVLGDCVTTAPPGEKRRSGAGPDAPEGGADQAVNDGVLSQVRHSRRDRFCSAAELTAGDAPATGLGRCATRRGPS